MRLSILMPLVALLAAGCSDDDSDPAGPIGDTTAPAAIADLDTTLGPGGQLLLRWTAPGDDGDRGTATAYDLRRVSSAINDTTWAEALPFLGVPEPKIAGSAQIFELGDAFKTGEHYFAIRAADEVPNWSELSNVVELGVEEPAPEYPLATNENQLVDNFEQAHRDRHFEEYEHLLGENFQFWFAPEDIDLAPNGYFWDRAADVASIQRMFNGAVGERPDGTPQPAVQNISLTLTPAEPAWLDAGGETVGGQTPVREGAKKRRYDVNMRVTYTEGDIVSEVNGEQLFYVIPTQFDLGGGDTATEWKMFLWREFGNTSKATVDTGTWGRLKALYER